MEAGGSWHNGVLGSVVVVVSLKFKKIRLDCSCRIVFLSLLSERQRNYKANILHRM